MTPQTTAHGEQLIEAEGHAAIHVGQGKPSSLLAVGQVDLDLVHVNEGKSPSLFTVCHINVDLILGNEGKPPSLLTASRDNLDLPT